MGNEGLMKTCAVEVLGRSMYPDHRRQWVTLSKGHFVYEVEIEYVRLHSGNSDTFITVRFELESRSFGDEVLDEGRFTFHERYDWELISRLQIRGMLDQDDVIRLVSLLVTL